MLEDRLPLAGSLQPAAVTPAGLPDLRVTNVQLTTPVVRGSTVTMSYTTKNEGTAGTGRGWTDRIYYSADAVPGAGDTLLFSVVQHSAALPAGGTETYPLQMVLPAGVPS